MKTRVLRVDADQPAPACLEEAALILARGGLVAFATETVYGLGAVVTDAAAVARIFEAKGRPAFNPLIVHVGGITQARQCTTAWPATAQRLAQRFWPGPLTLVLPRAARIPEIVTAGRDTVAVRVPAPQVARGLIERAGQPLAAPSANRSSRLSPTRAEHVLADLDGRIDLILDSGPTTLGLESTVLDLTSAPPQILRPGPVEIQEIEGCLGGLGALAPVPGAAPLAEPPASPGMLPGHYAPRTRSVRVDAPEELAGIPWPDRAAVLVFELLPLPALPQNLDRVDLADPKTAGERLYAVLHQLDAAGLDLIVVVLPPDRPQWRAIRDRLIRATRPCRP